MSNEINPMAFFQEPSVADLRLLACPGAEELTELIDRHLVEWAKSAGVEKDSFIIPCECPRFQSGDAKGLVRESVRGDDIFIVIDPGNYSVTYNLFGYENHLSPDDHFANLKRLIQAVAGKAHRVSVIMPSLYGGRQHRRVVRETSSDSRKRIRRFWYERQICIKNPDLFRTAPCISSVNGSYHPASCVLAGVKLLKDKPGNVLKLPGSSQKMDVCQLRNCMGQRTSLLL